MVSELLAQLGGLFAIAPWGIAALDPDGRIAQTNPALDAMFGYAPGELHGQFLDALAPESRDARSAAYSNGFLSAPRTQAMESGLDLLGRRKDGRTFTITLKLRYLPIDGRRAPVAFVTSAGERGRPEADRDQPARPEQDPALLAAQANESVQVARSVKEDARGIEATLRASEERFAKMFYSSPVATVISTTEDGCILEVNEQFLRLFGRTRDDVIGRRSVLLDMWDDPAERARLLEQLRTGGSLRDAELIVRAADGSRRAVLLSVDILELNEERCLLTTLYDISERKRAEEIRDRLAAIVDSSDDAIVSKTLDGTIYTWNPGAERLFGYSAAEIIGQPITILIPADRLEEEQRIIARIQQGEALAQFESVRRRKDGRLLDVALTLSPLKDAAGKIIGVSKVARDISERKRAEEALRRQTVLIRLLQDVAVAANQATGIEDVLQAAIDQICDCLGWPVGHVYLAPEDGHTALVSAPLWHVRDPERFAVFRTITEAIPLIAYDDLPGRVLLSGKPEWIADLGAAPSTVRTKLISDLGVRAGFAFPILVGAEVAAALEFFTTEPQPPDAALLDVMLHVGTQLSQVIERARVAEWLRAAEARYRTLVEQLPAIIYAADIDERSSTRYVSPQIEAILGFTPAEWLADPQRWIKQIHPEDRAQVLAELAEAHTADVPRQIEYRSIARDGRVVWLRDATRIVRDEQGGALYLQGITLDITERKQAEQALLRSELMYRTLARNFPNGAVFLFDRDLRYTIADGQALVAQGRLREPIEGRTLYDALEPEEIARQEPLYRAALSGQELVAETNSGGSTFITYYLPVRNDQGEIFAGMVVSHDITALKQAEQALVEERALLARRVEERTADLSAANAELARAARLKDEFLASMSHELRTPLNAILGLSEALREQIYGPLSEQQDRPLQMIEESGRHLLELINDILDLAKIGAGTLDLELDAVPIEALCRSCLRTVSQAAQKKQLSVQTLLDLQATYVLGDMRRLKQILINLLANAVKFTPAGGKIGLEVQCDAAQQALRFTVWDTGIGIPDDQVKRLFQPFVQLDSRLARQYEGTGLGLALVARLTELHGGSVAVSSKVGAGSRFTITLPWQAPIAPALVDAPPNETASIPIQRVLIIEDSPTSASQVERYLAELGIATEVLSLGAGAVSRACETQPDLILLDIFLPDTSGWSVLAQLKAEPRTCHIPVVIVSVADERQRGLDLGAAIQLVKPCTRHSLRQALAQFSRRPAPAARPGSQQRPQGLILLAEDNEASIMTVTDYLATLGYQTVVARNGVEALARAAELRPALVLMDIQMPEMDGLEAIRHMRADPALAAIPIVAMTALAMPGDREECLVAGADDYLSKPISLKELARLIDARLYHEQGARKG